MRIVHICVCASTDDRDDDVCLLLWHEYMVSGFSTQYKLLSEAAFDKWIYGSRDFGP